MEKERIELFEQRLFSFAKRVDVEKLRQEIHAHLRTLKEEQKESILQWLETIRAELEGLKQEVRVDFGPVHEEMKALGSKIKEEVNTALQPVLEEVGPNLRAMKEEIRTALVQQEGERASTLQTLQEERTVFQRTNEELKADFFRVKEGMEEVKELIKTGIGEMTGLSERVRDGFLEVREELGAMIKFSYADLDKRISALEARVKALEKLVSP